MSLNYPRERARKPRYRFAGEGRIRAEMERTADRLPNRIEVELLDLSRTGFRLKSPVPLERREPVSLGFRIGNSASALAMRGVVRWQRPARDGTWLAGCVMDCPIDWEVLGELFLDGVLSMDER